jgi:hypothetical protein
MVYQCLPVKTESGSRLTKNKPSLDRQGRASGTLPRLVLAIQVRDVWISHQSAEIRSSALEARRAECVCSSPNGMDWRTSHFHLMVQPTGAVWAVAGA